MSDIHWTPSLVEVYITEAAEVLARLPETRARGVWLAGCRAAPPATAGGCHRPHGHDAAMVGLA